jgi:hypothetical protein
MKCAFEHAPLGPHDDQYAPVATQFMFAGKKYFAITRSTSDIDWHVTIFDTRHHLRHRRRAGRVGRQHRARRPLLGRLKPNALTVAQRDFFREQMLKFANS